MSYDFDVRNKACDHLQTKERQTLSDDLRTLVNINHPEWGIRGAVASSSTVKLYMNGVEIPSGHAQYAWSLVPDLDALGDKRYKIMFANQLRFTQAIFEVSYFTAPAYCLKCNGYTQTNDFTISSQGSFVHVTDHNKLIQRVMKFLLSSSCPFYPRFTSRLKEFIGRKFGLSLTEEDISYECITALENMRNIQVTQKNVQLLSPEEILRNVESVDSKRDSVDPTIVKTQIRVSSYGPDRVNPLNFAIRTKN
jgi:hypothetical protein